MLWSTVEGSAGLGKHGLPGVPAGKAAEAAVSTDEATEACGQSPPFVSIFSMKLEVSHFQRVEGEDVGGLRRRCEMVF